MPPTVVTPPCPITDALLERVVDIARAVRAAHQGGPGGAVSIADADLMLQVAPDLFEELLRHRLGLGRLFVHADDGAGNVVRLRQPGGLRLVGDDLGGVA